MNYSLQCMNPNIEKALNYAKKMHEGVYRHDGSPYIMHPIRVAKYVETFKKSSNLEELIEAAYLHDTVEDTEATYYDIVNMFGPQVASLVLELTTDEDMKKILGKTTYLKIKMKNMSSWALVLKLCDRLDNVSDLANSSIEFQIKYTKETLEILEYLIQNRILSKTHIAIINQILKVLTPLEQEFNKDQEKIKNLTDSIKINYLIPKRITNNNVILFQSVDKVQYSFLFIFIILF